MEVLNQEKQCIIKSNKPDFDKIYLFAKDPYESKYRYLINKPEKVGLKHYGNPNFFFEYSNDMPDDYKNIEEYNPRKNVKY